MLQLALDHSTKLLLAGLVVLLACAVYAIWSFTIPRRRRFVRAGRGPTLPPLVFEVHDAHTTGLRPGTFGSGRTAPTAAASAASRSTGSGSPVAGPGHGPGEPAGDGATVRVERYTDTPFQLLPGHLEVERGEPRGEAIRFVRMRGEPAEITLGRGDGPPHRHVKLAAGSVSREHARLFFENGQWRITNLSNTNPTLVNGETLGDGTRDYRWLTDGDTIELGEMILRFRAR